MAALRMKRRRSSQDENIFWQINRPTKLSEDYEMYPQNFLHF